MRAVNFIKNKIEFAMKGNERITVDENLIEAFNGIIEYTNGNAPKNELQDALILFHLLQIWSVENRLNKAELIKEPKYLMQLSNTENVLEKLFVNMRPK